MSDSEQEQSGEDTHTTRLAVRGMFCNNCAVLIERKLGNVPHVQSAKVSYRKGSAQITHSGKFDLATLQRAIEEDGYTLSPWQANNDTRGSINTARDYLEIGAAFVILAAIVLLLRQFELIPRGLSVSDKMSYGLVFVIGLVASVSSCIAVTGGLLVAVAAKYNEANAHLTDVERLKPHLAFNVGRILSYTLLGGAIGALGSALTLSSELNGILTLAASGIMIILGLQMLKLVWIGRIIPTLPASFAHRIHDLAGRETTGAAFLLGASTFFLPCGFTQALQLYVLAKGTFATGALTMLAFVLGTLPALLSLSALSSFAKGAFQERFLKFAGAAVVLLGFLNIQYGLVLAGSGAFVPSTSVATEVGQAKEQTAIAQSIGPMQQSGSAIEPQRITMRVVDFDYLPNQFTVTQGVLVQWVIDGSQAVGCGRYLMAPGLGIRKLLSGNSTTLISFTPDRAGEFAFNCGMGMMTPDSKIVVVAKAKG